MRFLFGKIRGIDPLVPTSLGRNENKFSLRSLLVGISDFFKEQHLIGFLRAHRAHLVPHAKGPFLDHLIGTYKLLKKWGCEKEVCYAGLFHSIYGTQIFKHQTLSYKDRNKIKKLIGERAEHLAYLFSVSDRPRAFEEAKKTLKIYDTNENRDILISEKDIESLQKIERANLVEQR